jgi:hypothetical protein
MEAEVIVEVVNKLVGDVDPIGESNEDAKRFKNLKTLCDTIDRLLIEIQFVTRNETSYEDSVKKSGKYAREFLNYIAEEYSMQEENQDDMSSAKCSCYRCQGFKKDPYDGEV